MVQNSRPFNRPRESHPQRRSHRQRDQRHKVDPTKFYTLKYLLRFLVGAKHSVEETCLKELAEKRVGKKGISQVVEFILKKLEQIRMFIKKGVTFRFNDREYPRNFDAAYRIACTAIFPKLATARKS